MVRVVTVYAEEFTGTTLSSSTWDTEVLPAPNGFLSLHTEPVYQNPDDMGASSEATFSVGIIDE